MSMSKSKPRLACVVCLALVCAAALISVCALLLVRMHRGCEENGKFLHAAVAADSLTCSDIGRDILLEGGSAVDAAISALLCTSLINPQSMGIGGGSIFTIMNKDGGVSVINSRETVPKSFPPNLLDKCPTSITLGQIGAQWIGVPGELRGYQYAHSRFGKLPWARLFQPSIKLARKGFPVPEYLGNLLKHPIITKLVQSTSLCQAFCRENKTMIGPGDTLRYPKLADTLEMIAEKGPDAFYTGKIAEDLIQDVKAEGGSLSLEDLSSFKVRFDEALSVPLGDFTMHFPPPPFGGTLLSFILNVMQGFGLSPPSVKGEERKLTLHRYIETLKFANGQKKNIRDPLHSQYRADHLMDTGFADHIRSMISSSGTHPISYYNVTPSTDRFGTTHVSVLASDGSAVSVTSTINHIFGSGIYSPKTGIILNNEVADFCGRADSVSAGEQPPSSMSPVIIHSKHREKVLVIGGSGGSQIITGIATAIMNKLWLGMNLEDAINDKVVFVSSDNSVLVERGFNESMKKAMQSFGHDVKYNQFSFNVVNGIMKEHGCITAVSDGRKKGEASGY
ncbi:glutathione hydrolase 5 proenzyme [Ictalurus furcatus]|uniref:glutathione hydrolase 5 proenzyme n=1 Tax=Ictalurus furcatus TaxID=66913 RepID=UPI002350788B|nr:glutathione hydrolase 5 proenzyme [Ictalurus furcatus]